MASEKILSKEEIEDIMIKHNEAPNLRIAQKRLAEEVIKFIHGEESYNKALKITEALFSGDIASLSESELKDALSGVQTETITEEMNIVDMLVNTKILSSKREAREFITSGAVSLNGNKITDINQIISADMFIDNTYVIIKRGKKNYYVGKKI